MKKYIAECLGTGTLTLAVALSAAGTFPVPTPVIAALVVGLFVYSIGHISGAHLNPAVTIATWSIQKITWPEAAGYLVAQVAGALLAMFIARANGVVVGPPSPATMSIVWAELMGTFFLAFGIASVLYTKTPAPLAGVVVGGSLLLGVTLAALLGSGGILNPAVAFGVGSFNSAYLLGPLAGALLGMNVYKHLA